MISFCCLFLKVRYIIVFLEFSSEFPIIFVILPLGTCILSWADYCPLPVSSQTIAFSWQYIFLKSIFSLMWYNFFPSVYFLASYVLLWLICLCSVVWMSFPHCWAFILSSGTSVIAAMQEVATRWEAVEMLLKLAQIRLFVKGEVCFQT